MNYKENCHVSIDIPFMPEKPLIRFCIYKSNEILCLNWCLLTISGVAEYVAHVKYCIH